MARLIAILLSVLFLIGCDKTNRHNKTLTDIDSVCDTNPQLAMSKLDSIDKSSLSEFDRHHYDLLTVKAHDKAYITHTSDSLILDAIEYFSSRKYKSIYPEALYYGGRVCSDMRNYPQAMKFYQLAINNLTDIESNLELRQAILSQCAHILNNVGLNSMAVRYMEEVITISEQLNDSSAIAYNNILAAELYLNCRNTSFSKKHIMEAFKYSGCLDEADCSWLNVSFAYLLHMENKTDSALQIIRPCIQKVDSTCLNYTLANAAEIYLAAGDIDSAYMFARKLLSSNSDDNHIIGYSIVFSDKMRHTISTDSLRMLLGRYRYSLTKANDNNNAATLIIQQNHTIPDNHSNLRIVMLLMMAVIITIATLATMIRIKQRKKHMKTHPAETPYDTLIQNNVIKDTTVYDETSQFGGEEQQLSDQCDYTAESGRRNADVEATASDTGSVNAGLAVKTEAIHIIKESAVYGILVAKIENNKSITYSETIFEDLEILINSTYPGFTDKLATLSQKKISPTELRVALLIKCGFTTSKIANLLGKEPNTISSQKKSLAQKLLGGDSKAQALDGLIKSL